MKESMTPEISIHAPREGSDSSALGKIRYQGGFLSTLPARGATQTRAHTRQSSEISIHAPREGSDGDGPGPIVRPKDISIHAPREGSDPDPRAYKAKQRNFYPRSPRGERR